MYKNNAWSEHFQFLIIRQHQDSKWYDRCVSCDVFQSLAGFDYIYPSLVFIDDLSRVAQVIDIAIEQLILSPSINFAFHF